MPKTVKQTMMNKIKIIITFLVLSFHLNAQQTFVTEGRIEFERKINLHKQLEDYGSWVENFKDKIPQFRTDYFNLYFKDNKTLFEKARDNEEKIPLFGDDKSLEDIIYADLQHQTFIKKENVFGQAFLLSDSIRKVEWRITNDTRDIAGFECRKAVGKILDSVYIIAFYTDQIPVTGGPLSFCNLPGMVLGIAIPRISVTYFATKLELVEVPSSKLVPPPAKKLKTNNYKELESTLKNSMNDWGKEGRRYIINFLL